MTWKRFSTRKASRPVSYRPRLDGLESRVVPAPVTFRFRPFAGSVTLDPTLTISGIPSPVTPQAPGSLTTGYQGRNLGDFDPGALTIQFLDPGSSLVFAQTNGNWRPGDGGVPATTSPADYGGQFEFFGTNYAALRDVTISLTSPSITMTPTGGGNYSFPVTSTTFNLKAAFLDYETSEFLAGSGRTTFTGSASNTSASSGTMTLQGGGTYALSVPVEGTIVIPCVDPPDCAVAASVEFSGTVGGLLPPGPSPMPGAGNGVTPVDASEFSAETSTTILLDTPVQKRVSTQVQTADAPVTQTTNANPTARSLARIAGQHLDSVFADPLALHGF